MKAEDFVMFPKDPREFEDEAVPYLAAKYRSAIEECAKYSKKTELSASEVYDYMLEEAQKKWFAQLELNDIALHEIYFMIRDAVKANESELFFSAVRLSLPLFATTNAWKYVRIAFEVLLWRATASEEELYLFETLAFTRLTEFGEFQAVDMCQEKVNKMFRQGLPEKAGQGFESKMKNYSIRLNKDAAKSKPTESNDRRIMTFNEKPAKKGWEKVYNAVRWDMHAKQVWKRDGKVLFPANHRERNGPMKPVEEGLLTSPSWSLVSNQTMDWFPKGVDRCREYCESFYTCPKEYRHQMERSRTYDTGGVPLTSVMSTETAYKKDSDKHVALATSISQKEIIAAADKKKSNIKAAIQHTRTLLAEVPLKAKYADTLQGLSKELVRLREIWMVQEVQKNHVTRKELILILKKEERERGAKTTEKSRTQVVESSAFFYKNHPTVQSKFNVHKKINMLL